MAFPRPCRTHWRATPQLYRFGRFVDECPSRATVAAAPAPPRSRVARRSPVLRHPGRPGGGWRRGVLGHHLSERLVSLPGLPGPSPPPTTWARSVAVSSSLSCVGVGVSWVLFSWVMVCLLSLCGIAAASRCRHDYDGRLGGPGVGSSGGSELPPTISARSASVSSEIDRAGASKGSSGRAALLGWSWCRGAAIVVLLLAARRVFT